MSRKPPKGYAIDTEKIGGYLLKLNHPRGHSKAKFFIGHGFDPARPEELALEIFKHAALGRNPYTSSSSAFGTKFVFSGLIDTPNNSTATIITVWLEEPGDPTGYLVMAYPA